MKMKLSVLLAGMLAAFGASAQADRVFQDMGDSAGIRAREARMLTGAPSSYAEYRTSYWQARDRMRRAARGEYGPPRAYARPARIYAPAAAPVYAPPPQPEQALQVEEAETFPIEEH